MKLAIVLLALMFQTQTARHTIFVVDKVIQTAEAHNKFGGVGASSGEHHTAPVVMAEFSKRCPAVSFTQNRATAEFVLETQPGSTTLTDAKGNVLYVSPAKRLKNMVKDVCGYVSGH
jgi:hypothetical protein